MLDHYNEHHPETGYAPLMIAEFRFSGKMVEWRR